MVLNCLATVLIQGYQIRMSFEFAMVHPAWAVLGLGIYLAFYYSIFVEEKRVELLSIGAGTTTRRIKSCKG